MSSFSLGHIDICPNLHERNSFERNISQEKSFFMLKKVHFHLILFSLSHSPNLGKWSFSAICAAKVQSLANK